MTQLISFDAEQVQTLAVIGLLYDIVGALMLSRALMWSRPQELAKQQEPKWCGNPDLLYELCKQTFDAKWGAWVLVIGFIMQAASSFGLSVNRAGFIGLTAALFALIAAYAIRRRRRVRAKYMRAVDALAGDEKDREIMRGLFPGG